VNERTATAARLVRTSVTVEAPATTANLGAGFDCLALALDIANTTRIEVVGGPPGSLELVVHGEGRGTLDSSGTDRCSQALRLALRELGVDPDALSWRITMDNRIPLSRGLGSSASATVAGLLAARALSGGVLDIERLLQLACQAEGHADNASAALLGGFVVVSHAAGDAQAVRIEPPASLVAALFIPDRPLSTGAMRAALPAQVPFADAVHNVGASSLAVAAFASGRLDLLVAATDDRLHEPYRATVYPELPALIAAARRAGALGACLSGAGSSVIAFADSETLAARLALALEAAAQAAGLPGHSLVVRPRARGAFVVD
jgi:homoserine kinase